MLINEYHSVNELLENRERNYIDLYQQKRAEEEERPFNQFTLQERKRLHQYVLATYKTIDRLSGITYQIISDRRTKEVLPPEMLKGEVYEKRRPVIYVPTHIGKNDIQAVSEAIKGHYYLLSGDYEHIQGDQL